MLYFEEKKANKMVKKIKKKKIEKKIIFLLVLMASVSLFTLLMSKNLPIIIYRINYIQVNPPSMLKQEDNNKISIKLDDTSSCICEKNPILNEIFKNVYLVNKKPTTTCNLDEMFKRGYNQNVIAIVVKNLDIKVYNDLKSLSKLISEYLPDWIIRVYHESNSNAKCEFLCKNLSIKNIDFCSIEDNIFLNEAIRNNTFVWKWLTIADEFVQNFIAFDYVSHSINNNFIVYIQKWLKSNLLFFIMRGR